MWAVRADALLGEYDGGGKMSKGLGVEAHDLGWDGGQDYRASGVTYSRLSVSGAPSVSMQASYPEWEDLTSAPPAYGSGVPAYSNRLAAYGSGMQYTTHRMPAYSNSVAAYTSLPGSEQQRAEFVRDKAAPPASGGGDAASNSWFPDWDELTSSRPEDLPASSTEPTASSSGGGGGGSSSSSISGSAAEGLHSAINTGLKAAWDSLAGTVRVNGCDEACIKDIYRRAFRAHNTHQAHVLPPKQGSEEEEKQIADRDNQLFGQVPSKVDVSPSSFSEAYRDVSSIGVTAAPKVLQVLSNYLPLAVEAEKQLARAIAQRQYGQRATQMGRRAADQEHHSQFQYKLRLNDEFDAQGQRHLRRFVEDDDAEECKEGDEDCEEADDGKWYKTWHVVVDAKTHQPVEQAPTLMCGEGDKKEENTWGKQDRMDDCNFIKEGDDTQPYYNRMFYLDREKSGHPASARLIHNHMQGVRKLVDKWKPLLVGAGGGSGEPGAYDDPYYFCYDQYQEDPEFSQCLRDLSEHRKTFKIRKWARPAIAGPGDGDAPIRPGFPELRKEWEEEMKKDPTATISEKFLKSPLHSHL
jgi:hypothetical protein